MNDEREQIEALIMDSVARRGRARTDAQGARFAADALLPWLAEHDRAVAAAAWDEGFDAGERDVWEHEASSYESPCISNPYGPQSVSTPKDADA